MDFKKRILSKRVERQYRSSVRALSIVGLELHDWQTKGVRWMLNREQDICCRGGFLFDDMGLGKTLEMISVMMGNKVDKTLLVLPSSLINQWRTHLKKYDPELNIIMHHGNERLTSSWELENVGRLLVMTSYEMTFRRKKNPNFFPTILHKINWDRIVCDECHLIRNGGSKRTLGVLTLNGGIRWGLTGTPIHNGVRDFVNLFHFHKYSSDYIIKNMSDLKERYTLRRTKKNLGVDMKLPGLDIQIHKIDFSSEEEREFYRRVRGEVREEFARLRNMRFNITSVLELLMRSRQSCIYPQMVIDAHNKRYDSNIEKWRGSVSKIQKIAEMIQQQKRSVSSSLDKTLVFSYFKEEMILLKKYLCSLGFNVSTIDGTVSLSEREKIMCHSQFDLSQFVDGCQFGIGMLPQEILQIIMSYYNPVDVLIVQINTGSTGLNLQMFNHVYFSSPCWNPALEDQAICRSYRLGQKKKVTVHKMIMYDSKDDKNNTIEEKIVSIQEEKRKIMSDLLEDPELLNNGIYKDAKGLKNRLTVDDFINLLA